MKKLPLLFIILLFFGNCNQEKTSFQVVDTPDISSANAYYTSTRSPLQPYPLLQLPVGNVQPKGWLKEQLNRMTEGYIGHLYEISPFLQDNSGWLGGDERGWEEAPYWFRGFYDLSVLTEDNRIDSVANRWIEAVIRSRDKDGYYGSNYNKLVVSDDGKKEMVDVWPHMVMNDALISHYEATRDERVIPLLTDFFKYCHSLPDSMFLPQTTWDYYENYNKHFGDWKPRIQLKRAGDFIPQIYWLYNRTGNQWLLDFALKVYQKTMPEMNQWLDNHVVHFMQRFRYNAQMYPLTRDSFYLDKSKYFYRQFMLTWGRMPRGAFAGDERIRHGKVDPRQGFETCAMVESNKSHYILGNMSGKAAYADKVEDMTFNWLPVSHTPDLKGVRYITAANMPTSVPNMDFHNQGLHAVFGASMHRCCQHNSAMGWPWFTKNMWKASLDNGLVAWLYGPNEVTAKVGKEGEEVRIMSNTNYPFSDEIHMKLNVDQEVAFPLYLRVPGWAKHARVEINGREQQSAGSAHGRYVKILRTWNDGDGVSLHFNPQVKLTEWPRTKAVTLNRGPLSYSVRIKEDWIKMREDQFGWDVRKIEPDAPWNYGVVKEEFDQGKGVQVNIQEKIARQPWKEGNAPIVLKVPAKKIPDWQVVVRNTVDPLREGPVRSDQNLEMIEMIPMGAAHLRLTCLPVVSDSENARYWKDIPDPNEFMLERLTH